jgi:site-specific DNA recombinase
VNPSGETGPRTIRCAVYTRKSTEEGLQQSFNSLHAQRDAAEAYVHSQESQGWRLLEQGYDDGGFTGANMERPALRRLLDDIALGRVDCVLVYKVDRLSRSLLDFARVMEIFDRHGVSFVSVTQQFNTALSLGRLTLNVLLSFAQFEREIIGERTRDKHAAARRKGKWTGGFLVLGYDSDPRGARLQVNEREAIQVRAIFDLFAEKRAIAPTLAEIARRGWTTKSWTTRREKLHCGGPFSEDSLRRLLTNRLYIARVRQGDQDYPGEHPAIVDQARWDEVQQLFRSTAERRRPGRKTSPAGLLVGLLWCGHCGAPMAATMCRRRGVAHRYYVCPAAVSSGGKPRCSSRSLPLADFEQIVRAELNRTDLEQVRIPNDIESVRYSDADGRLIIKLKQGRELALRLERTRVSHGRIVLRRAEEAHAEGSGATWDRVPRISRLVALALWLEQLLHSGAIPSMAETARLGHVARARVTQIMNLLDLAPDIQERLLFLPPTPGGRDLVSERDVRSISREPHWDRQRQLLAELLNRRKRSGSADASSVQRSHQWHEGLS